MICFNLKSARHLVESLQERAQHFLHTDTICVHGPSVEVPTIEMQPRCPFDGYGIQKAAIVDEARRNGFPGTVLYPGHIVGPVWPPLNPAGNFNPDVLSKLAQGGELALLNIGLETVHHVHTGDVAQLFMQAITN